jgi:hypothetical protein
MIRFSGLILPGLVVKGFEAQPPEQLAIVDTFPGVDGEVRTLLGRGGRNIVIPMKVFDATLRTYSAVAALIAQLDQRVGEVTEGQLDVAIGNGDSESFPNCSFLGYQRLSDILPDVSFGLVKTRLTYFVDLVLFFRQHAYEK